MDAYVNVTEVGMFLLVGLLFIVLNLVLLAKRYTRARFAMLSILATSVWPALMIVLSVNQLNVMDQLTSGEWTLNAVIAWAVVLSTALMTMIPAGVFLHRLVTVSRLHSEL
ncbi:MULTISPECIES: hypothetical protein [Exiguobacterium]|uniref:Uncharacterized protein n=1 Tax=Exiguobacterium marinum TaxID=273528 RepID=A0ABY7WV91_9BACL|nr:MULTISPECIES: hypothetical protein [Exiguobacterium]WDH74798.1 hypothetical protein PTI97_08115 [Exiguobacterium marinum]